MSFAFIPLYIKYLGIEAYGLIGIFGILQAWLLLLDGGLKPSLVREMARFKAGAHEVDQIRDLLRTVEVVGIAIAMAIALSLWTASDWLSHNWISTDNLDASVAARAFAIMGIIIALQFIESIYTSSIVGLQLQVLESVLTSIVATIRGVGAVIALKWVSPSIDVFFFWQVCVSLVSAMLLGCSVYWRLPKSSRMSRFSIPALKSIRRFAGGVMVITLLALLLTQVDKILLSRLLSLKEFSYYALASTVVGTLPMLTKPITTAFYPRFTEYVTRKNGLALSAAYHQAAQVATVTTGTAAIVLIVFAERVLSVWTRDPSLVSNVAPLLSVLAVGTLLNTMMWIPYHLQIAHGWTGLAVRINIVAVLILIPAMSVVIPKYGGIGAAWIWVFLNCGYVLFMSYFMHKRLLPAEKRAWAIRDVGQPLLIAFGVASLCNLLIPQVSGMANEIIALFAGCLCVFGSTIASSPILRQKLISIVNGQ